jgi:uncharacterized Tic20 family protein
MSAPGSNPPPGWYPDPAGQQRWWTGATWGAYAPAVPMVAYPTSAPGSYPGSYPAAPPYPGAPPWARRDATTLALLSHLGALIAGFIVPLIIYVTSGKDDPFVRHHSSEALNFAITYLFASLAMMMLFFVSIILLPLLIIVIPAFFALIISQFVWLIMAAVKASRGEWWRYPIAIRLVPGLDGEGATPR